MENRELLIGLTFAVYLLVMLVIGLIAWIVNSIWGWIFYQQDQKVPAYLLWGTAVIVQLAVWGAVLNLLNYR